MGNAGTILLNPVVGIILTIVGLSLFSATLLIWIFSGLLAFIVCSFAVLMIIFGCVISQ